MREMVRLGFILMIVCVTAAAALAWTNFVTADRIAAQLRLEKVEALQEVLPGATEFRDESTRLEPYRGREEFSALREVWAGFREEALVGAVIVVAPQGYGGPVTLLVGCEPAGSVAGIKVLAHAETPGLGANITLDAFRQQFVGKSTGKPIKVVKARPAAADEIQAVSAATISSRAVVGGVNAACRFFEEVYRSR